MIEVRNLTKKYRELVSWERMERAKVRCSDV